MAKILVVDDRPTNRQFLLTLLGYADHRLLEAGDGAQALELVRAERPDLVITDILMPTMDGYEFVQRVRADSEIAATRIIFYTATYSATEAKSLAQTCGVDAVLPKPCEPQEIFAAVNRSLGIDAQAPETGVAIGATGAKEVRELNRIGDKLSDYLGELGNVKETMEGLIGRGEKLSADRKRLKQLSQQFAENLVGLQAVTARLTALDDLSAELMAERKPERIITTFLRAATRIVGSTHSAIGILDEREQELLFLVARGFEAEILREHGMDRARLPGSLLEDRTPVRWTKSRAKAPAFPAGHPPVRNFLGLRIATEARVYGWLYFAGKLGAEEFSDEDERLAATMAAQLALLYDNASLYHLIQHHAAQLQIEVNERRRAQEALQESEAGLHRAQVMAKIAHVITGADGEFLKRSETLAPLVDLDAAAMPGATREWLELIHPEDRARFRAAAIEAGKTGNRSEIDYRLKRREDWVHIRQVLEPLTGEPADDGKPRWFNTLQDVTEQKRAENRIRRLNRVYAVLSGINSTIVRVRDRDELFKEACRIAVEAGELTMAWIGVIERGASLITPVAWHGSGSDYVQLIQERLQKSEFAGRGLALQAVGQRKTMIVDDMKLDPRVLLREEALERGFRSLVILPLVVEDAAIGVLSLYAGEAGFFDAEEMKLLHELAGDIAFAIDHIAKAEKLDYLAYYDSLTGLANRTLFRERLDQFLVTAAQDKREVAVMVIDLERFRSINETLGRQAGDELLQQIADRARRVVTDPNWLSRIGPDQFASAIPAVASSDAVVRRIEQGIQKIFGDPFKLGEAEVRVSVRFGIAMFPDDGTDADALLRNAEAALRKAKASSDRYLFYTQEMTARVAENLALENRLRTALEKEEFVLHYQPKVDLETRSVTGVEALIRWNSPERGLVPPGLFIPLLEETGLILPVGAWALARAVRDHGHLLAQGVPAPRIAVNVSVIQLRQRDFVDTVKQAIARGADPTAIDLEITESLLMEDVAGNIEKLKALRDLGMKISIDDFGTGYSSLGYLAKLPVHTLKIDRSFIISMLKDADTMTLVSTIISLAHSLKLTVVAEGVEEEEQAKVLRLLRCDEMQGYLISKPVPMEQLTPLLRGTK